MPTLRLGSTAPDFQAQTTNGPISFHEYIGDNWAILFSHPSAETPICLTELPAFAKLEPEFTKRGVTLLVYLLIQSKPILNGLMIWKILVVPELNSQSFLILTEKFPFCMTCLTIKMPLMLTTKVYH